tara:strand:- start:151 stop:672 length:522 start_codon:yes stop_codon:yes gene_type:complete
MLNELIDLKKKKNKKRLGRGIGSGKGKTSGKGHKGQKSRSGVSLKGFEGGQMPLHRRLPKRGFNNNFRKQFNVINLVKLQHLLEKKIINKNDEITVDFLLKKKIIKKAMNGIKILGKGDIKEKINIKATKVSKVAKKKIEKIGGQIELIKKNINKVKTKDDSKETKNIDNKEK